MLMFIADGKQSPVNKEFRQFSKCMKNGGYVDHKRKTAGTRGEGPQRFPLTIVNSQVHFNTMLYLVCITR